MVTGTGEFLTIAHETELLVSLVPGRSVQGEKEENVASARPRGPGSSETHASNPLSALLPTTTCSALVSFTALATASPSLP